MPHPNGCNNFGNSIFQVTKMYETEKLHEIMSCVTTTCAFLFYFPPLYVFGADFSFDGNDILPHGRNSE